MESMRAALLVGVFLFMVPGLGAGIFALLSGLLSFRHSIFFVVVGGLIGIGYIIMAAVFEWLFPHDDDGLISPIGDIYTGDDNNNPPGGPNKDISPGPEPGPAISQAYRKDPIVEDLISKALKAVDEREKR